MMETGARCPVTDRWECDADGPNGSMFAPNTLRFWLGRYAVEHGLAESSAKALGFAISSLEKHLGRQAVFADLGPDTVNDWLGGCLERIEPITVSTYRRQIVTLWRAAAEAGLAAAPCRVRRIKVPCKIPTAWSREELATLLSNADVALKALILVGYETGLRLGDLLRMPAVDSSGRFSIVQVVATKDDQIIYLKTWGPKR